MPHRQPSITTHVILILLIVATLLFTTLGTIDHLAERARRQASLRTNAKLAADQLAASLALPVWNFDQSQIDKILDGIIPDDEVYGVMVQLNDASSPNKTKTLSRFRSPDGSIVKDSPLPRADSLTETRDIFSSADSDAPIGHAQILITPTFMEQDLLRQLIYRILTFIAFGIILTASLYFLLWRTVLKPLNLIEQFAGQVSNGTTTPAANPRAPHFRGELASLRASIEKMVTLLANRYHSLQQNQSMLSAVLNSAPQSIFWKDREGRYLGCNEHFARMAGLQRPDLVIGKTDLDLPWPREDSSKYRADDRAVIDSKIPKRRFVEPLHTFDGSNLWVETTKLPLLDAHGTAYGVLGVFEDITARLNAQRRIESQLRFEELVARISSLVVVANPANIDATLAQALAEIARLLNAHRVVLGQHDPGSNRMVARAHFHCGGPPFPPQLIISDRYPNLWQALLKGQVSTIHDTAVLNDSLDRDHFLEVGIKSQVTVPVQVEGSLQFILAVASTTPIHWPDEAVARIRVLAEVIASTVLRCQAEQASLAYTRRIAKLATELTRSEERQRRELATTLHDGVGQNLFAATTQLLAVRTRIGPAQVEVDKALSLLDQVTRDTRELTFELCPPVLYQLGLAPALQRLVDQFAARYQIQATLQGEGAGPADLNLRGLAYQAVRELLANIAKHAHAKTVTVQLQQNPSTIQISVTDDGIGFNPQSLSQSPTGFGLFQIRERIELLGGQLLLNSTPAQGTTAQFHLPLGVSTSQ